MASPKASAASFSFMATSIAFLALPVLLLLFRFDFFFPFFFLVSSAVAPPRRVWYKNGSDDPLLPVAVAGIIVFDVKVVVAVIAVANFVHDEQTITRDKNVIILLDGDIVGVSRGRRRGEVLDGTGDDGCPIAEVLLYWDKKEHKWTNCVFVDCRLTCRLSIYICIN